MELEGYKIEIKPKHNLIIVEHPNKSVSLSKLRMYKNTVTFTTKREYYYGIIKHIPGYYFSYDLRTNAVIVCGTLDKQDCLKRTIEYVEINKDS